MKRAVILMVVMVVALTGMLTAVPLAGANHADGIIYVDASAAGANDGTSWADAFVFLQDALADAENGDEIWVARGTYYPDEGAAQQDGNRTSTFGLVGNVGLYGGFAGGETARAQRDWAANPALLSGEIQQDGNRTNNAYHVVYAMYSGVVFDGFTVTRGAANSCDWEGKGGGMLIDEVLGSLTIANCTFYDNRATNGGGIYNELSSPVLVDCTFEANDALVGAGMYNHYMADPTLTGCSFVGNWASHSGGGMFSDGSCPTLEGCTFVGNQVTSSGSGGGMTNQSSSPVLANCTFEANQAQNGGGMLNAGNVTKPSLSGCTFRGNLAWEDAGSEGEGGGMYNKEDAAPAVTDCLFLGNFADRRGGGMRNDNSSPAVDGTTFDSNRATYGGGMYNSYSSPSLGNCTFAHNTADGNGGGLCNDFESDAVVGNCTFAGNWAGGRGGGVYNERLIRVSDCLFQGNLAMSDGGGYACMDCGTYGNVTNCAFWGNRSYSDGGGIFVGEDSEATVTNCSFHANSAGPLGVDDGGAIYVDCFGWAKVTNSILWGDCPDEIYVYGSASVYNSDVQGGWGGTGDYNIAVDPMWADPSVGDFHLLVGSQCIDAGDNAGPDVPAFDFEGDDRIIDGDGDETATVDMGIDEAKPATALVFYDGFEDWTLGAWVQDPQNDWKNSGQWAKEGTRSAEVDGMAGDAALSMALSIDLEGAWDATLSFSWLIESGLDGGEYLALDFWDGGQWVEVASLQGNADAENVWHDEVIDIAPQFFVSDFNLQFRGKMSLSLEDAVIDEVLLMATVP